MLKDGTIVTFLLLLAMTIVFVYYVQKIKEGWTPVLRNIAAIDALKEYVGRAVEMGRPMHYTSGTSGEITSARFPNVLSGLKIAGYLAELCGRMGAELICSIPTQTILPVAEDVIRSGFEMAGTPEKYNYETVQFTGGQYIGRTMGNIARYNIACNVFVGDVGSKSWIISEAAARIGATQIAGTPNDSNMVVLVMTSDYTLLGDEQYTAGAYISKSPADLGSVMTMDLFKALVIGLLALNFILTNMGVHLLGDILRL